jgi:hypothetical protein
MLTLILRKKPEAKLFPIINKALEDFFKSLDDALDDALLDDLIGAL